jgi:hypothetical protein
MTEFERKVIAGAKALVVWEGEPPFPTCRRHPMAYNFTCPGCQMAKIVARRMLDRVMAELSAAEKRDKLDTCTPLPNI